MQDERFEWHDRKARTNLRDHGVTFEEAAEVFDDEAAIDEIEHSMDYGEERWTMLGMSNGQLMAVIYTMRGTRFRIISARKADPHEQERYFDQGR